MKLAGEGAGDSPSLPRELIRHFAVIIFLGSVRHLPVSSPELDDLQQQKLGQGAEPLLQKEAISEEGEELIHPLGIHLLQLLTDAVELQDQAVHLLLLLQAVGLCQPEQAVIHRVHQSHHGHVVHPQVVEDVADEGDVADPGLERAGAQLLPVLVLLLQPVQQAPPEDALANLFALCL